MRDVTPWNDPMPAFVGLNYARSTDVTIIDVYADREPTPEEGEAYIPQTAEALAVYRHALGGGVSVPVAIHRARAATWRPV